MLSTVHNNRLANVLSNIAPADIRGEVATSRMILRARLEASLNSLYSPILTFTPDHDWNWDVRYGLTPRMRHRPSNTSGTHGGKSLMSQTSHWIMTLPSSYREWTCPVSNGACMQQHAWVGLHRLATQWLRWTPNNEAYCEWVPVDLLRRTWCGIQLAAEMKFEIVKANDNNNNANDRRCFCVLSQDIRLLQTDGQSEVLTGLQRSSPSMTGVPHGCGSQLLRHQQTACPWWEPCVPLSWLWDGRGWRACHLRRARLKSLPSETGEVEEPAIWDGRGWRACHLSRYEGRFLLLLCQRFVLAPGQRNSQRALFVATADFEWLRGPAIELHCSLRVSVERVDHELQFGWATDHWENVKEAVSAD